MERITFSDIFKKKYTKWDDLEKAIESLPTTKAVGDAFEQFIYVYFVLNGALYSLVEIYMSKDIPNKYRDKYKIGNLQHRDSGVDGLIIRDDGKSFAYQCKFRSGREKPTYEELTKFWSDARYCDYCCTVANSYTVSNLSDKHEHNLKILVDDLDALNPEFFENLYNYVNGAKSTYKKVVKAPYDYQERIIREVLEGLKIEDRGKIIAACGTGKTLTALWMIEKMSCDKVLFLVPSIALVKQTLEAWAANCIIPFTYLCVCSDETVDSEIEADDVDIPTSNLGVPVTTNEEEIAKFLCEPTGKRKYVFCTYQSTDKISNAQKLSKDDFDLIICDEAHRTTGMRSRFSLALEDQYIRSKKRLFMTATERMVRPMLLRRAKDNGQIIFSMDDESIYGPQLSRYNFGDAISDKTISDYKIIVAGVKENEVYNYIANNTTIAIENINEEEKVSSAEALYSKIILAKTMREFPVRKVISFHSRIQRALDFVKDNQESISLRNVINEFNQHISNENLYIDTVNSRQNTEIRSKVLKTFKDKDYSIVSNAKCLTEGVDVPIIDSVYFVDTKKSLVEIVQACGRALRTKKGVNKTAYFIVPILIPETEVASDILYSEQFEVVYNIIQALRDQDTRLVDWIDRLNKKFVCGQHIGQRDDDKCPIEIHIEGVDIQQFSEELFVKIATVNADPVNYRSSKTFYGRNERRAGQARILKTIGDFTYYSFMTNLVKPTIAKYLDTRKKSLASTEIKINHNNVSHTKKLGLIRRDNRDYTLTELGVQFLNGKIDETTLFRRQILRYSCSLEDNRIDRILFPYRALLEILSRLGKNKSINFFEFAFCIYNLYDSSIESIVHSVADIHYLREKYPNLQAINIGNRGRVLAELNDYYNTTLTETDIWGSMTTTIKNQYMYFRDHLSIFSDIIEINHGVIYMKDGTQDKVKKLLAQDKSFEELDKHSIIAKYTEAFMLFMLFSIT
ncbi:MAG: DEAD/DEAH box helicase family protein [Bacteroidales bacterium]|nr:DEAD/DEAH box helicase family protein [Bacteroidales bacterium]